MATSPNDRYNRWQGLAIAQLSVAVALLSALSVAGLGTGLALLQNKEFMAALQHKTVFAFSFLFFFVTAVTSCVAVVSRTMDFRLTARTARKSRIAAYDRPLRIFWLGAECYGQLTWFFFWLACLSFIAAGTTLAIATGSVYAPLLLGKIGT
jgi:hypothetical protein